MASPPSARTDSRGPAIPSPATRRLLERRLVIVTGKGGVGKTTVSAALALLAAERRLRTLVIELSDQRRLPGLFADESESATAAEQPGDRESTTAAEQTETGSRGESGSEVLLAENLWSTIVDQDRATLEWLQSLGGRVPGRVLAGSGTFQYFAAAAPGASELVSMVKISELAGGERWRRRSRRYDLVVLDAPATGHALGLLQAPYTFGAIARVGPIFGQAERVRELLQDPARTAYVAVTHASEMALGETLDLRAGLRSLIGRELDAVVVNSVLPRRFDADELTRLDGLIRAEPAMRAAQAAARSMHERARIQHNHIARLRRSGLPVHTLPFVFTPVLRLDAISSLSHRLSGWA
jgi:anion-transporting  ArsA/GET3 family ATPase